MLASEGQAKTAYLEEGLGRLGYAKGALSWDRPFLAPLYKNLASQPRGVVRVLPPFVIFLLNHLARAVAEERVYPCAERLVKAPRKIRVDSQAFAERCGIGGWMVAVDPQGHPDPWSSPWFSEEIREEDAGWVFAREGKASRTIATLEGLATLVGILLFSPVSAPGDRVEQTIVPSLTDNKENMLMTPVSRSWRW